MTPLLLPPQKYTAPPATQILFLADLFTPGRAMALQLDGRKVVKFSVIGFNVVFLIVGLALIIFGTTIATPFGDYFSLKTNAFSTKLGLRIGLIFLILIVSGLSFFAAAKENNRLLTLLAVLYFIMFVTELSMGIVYFSLRGEGNVKDSTSANGYQLLSIYGSDAGVTKALDEIQSGFGCCGVMDYRDWFTSGWAAKQGVTNRVPSSCCKVPSPQCGWDMDIKNPVDIINIIGCTGLNYFHDKRQKIIGGAGLGIGFLHLATILCCIVFSCCFNSVGGLSPADAIKGKEAEYAPEGGDAGGESGSSPGKRQSAKKSVPAFQEPFDDDDDLPENSSQDLLDKSKGSGGDPFGAG
ncbi:hypothetical protein QZH41_020766, partial [Actinostola sp. cb2023]